jgi:hypothetical protein
MQLCGVYDLLILLAQGVREFPKRPVVFGAQQTLVELTVSAVQLCDLGKCTGLGGSAACLTLARGVSLLHRPSAELQRC